MQVPGDGRTDDSEACLSYSFEAVGPVALIDPKIVHFGREGGKLLLADHKAVILDFKDQFTALGVKGGK